MCEKCSSKYFPINNVQNTFKLHTLSRTSHWDSFVLAVVFIFSVSYVNDYLFDYQIKHFYVDGAEVRGRSIVRICSVYLQIGFLKVSGLHCASLPCLLNPRFLLAIWQLFIILLAIYFWVNYPLLCLLVIVVASSSSHVIEGEKRSWLCKRLDFLFKLELFLESCYRI